jgi:hypothetical protein
MDLEVVGVWAAWKWHTPSATRQTGCLYLPPKYLAQLRGNLFLVALPAFRAQTPDLSGFAADYYNYRKAKFGNHFGYGMNNAPNSVHLTLHISRMFLKRGTKGVLFEKIAPFAGNSRKNSLLLIRLFACI